MVSGAVLAVGTEITTGQITDTNSSWLSAALVDVGVHVILHMTVADDRQSMLAALSFCLQQGTDLVLLTGGLGPTSDDFTRNVVAEFIGQPLVYEAACWQHIVQRCQDLGITAAPANKVQCYFPAGATILANDHGTAAGFAVDHAGVRLLCLPGPPHENQRVFTSQVMPQLFQWYPLEQTLKLHRWHVMGIPEAALGEIVEAAIDGSGLVTGYRPRLPYVEVKVWQNCQELRPEDVVALRRLDECLAEYMVGKDDYDLAVDVHARLQRRPATRIVDGVTDGLLWQRLTSGRRTGSAADQALCSYEVPVVGGGFAADRGDLVLPPANPEKLGFFWQGQWLALTLPFSVTAAKIASRRFRTYFAELALLKLRDLLPPLP